MRAHHLTIFKATGMRRIGLALSGRGLWCIECTGCPPIEVTFTKHSTAVKFAAAHIKGHAPVVVNVTAPGLDGKDVAEIREALDSRLARVREVRNA